MRMAAAFIQTEALHTTLIFSRNVQKVIRFIIHLHTIDQIAIAALPAIVTIVLWIVVTNAVIVAVVLPILWPVTLLLGVLAAKWFDSYQSDRLTEVADGLNIERVLLADTIEGMDGDDAFPRCREAMRIASQGLVNSCVRSVNAEQKRIAFLHRKSNGEFME